MQERAKRAWPDPDGLSPFGEADVYPRRQVIRWRLPGSAESIHFSRLRMLLFEAIDQEKDDQQ
jgi:hypothetical protein